MRKYIRTPEDPVLDSSVMSAVKFPGMHPGRREGKMLIGPDRVFGEYRLGNINASRMQLVVITYNPGGHTTKHIHDDQVQAYYIVLGEAVVTIGDDEVLLSPDGIALIPPWIPHGFRNVGAGLLTLLDIHSYLFEDVPASNIGIAQVIYGPNGHTGTHSHQDRDEAYFLVSGRVSICVEDEEATVGAGTVAYIPRNHQHRYRNVGGEPLKMIVVSSHDLAQPHPL